MSKTVQGKVPDLKQWQAAWVERTSNRKPQAEFALAIGNAPVSTQEPFQFRDFALYRKRIFCAILRSQTTVDWLTRQTTWIQGLFISYVDGLSEIEKTRCWFACSMFSLGDCLLFSRKKNLRVPLYRNPSHNQVESFVEIRNFQNQSIEYSRQRMRMVPPRLIKPPFFADQKMFALPISSSIGT